MFTESTTYGLPAFIDASLRIQDYTDTDNHRDFQAGLVPRTGFIEQVFPLPGLVSKCLLLWLCVPTRGLCTGVLYGTYCGYTRRRGVCYSRGGSGVDRLGGVPLGSCLVRSSASVHAPALRALACWTHADSVVLPKLACACSLEVPGRHACLMV